MSHCINIISAKANPTMEVTVRKVKNDRINIQEVYSQYGALHTDAFRSYCVDVIEASSGKAQTKMKFRNALMLTKSKDRMLKIVNDYYLAGNGLKV